MEEIKEPINIKDYVLKTEVAKKLEERIKEETLYAYLGIGGPILTYIAMIFGGVWLGIIPIGLVGVLIYLRLIKLKKAQTYIKDKYATKIEQTKEFI